MTVLTSSALYEAMLNEVEVHPASAKLRHPIRRITPADVEAKRNNAIIRRANTGEWRSFHKDEPEKQEAYQKLKARYKAKRFDKAFGDTHTRRKNVSSARQPIHNPSTTKEWNGRDRQYLEPALRVRLNRASVKGGFHTQDPEKVLSKNPKKQRKDNAITRTIDANEPKAKYKDWAKEHLKDSYEFLINYLIEERFVDTYEDAIHLLPTMSDEWLEDILFE